MSNTRRKHSEHAKMISPLLQTVSPQRQVCRQSDPVFHFVLARYFDVAVVHVVVAAGRLDALFALVAVAVGAVAAAAAAVATLAHVAVVRVVAVAKAGAAVARSVAVNQTPLFAAAQTVVSGLSSLVQK